jgi:hypothetical protein
MAATPRAPDSASADVAAITSSPSTIARTHRAMSASDGLVIA